MLKFINNLQTNQEKSFSPFPTADKVLILEVEMAKSWTER